MASNTDPFLILFLILFALFIVLLLLVLTMYFFANTYIKKTVPKYLTKINQFRIIAKT